jgi:hypothetical protein
VLKAHFSVASTPVFTFLRHSFRTGLVQDERNFSSHTAHTFSRRRPTLNHAILTAYALMIVVLVLALAREVRLRRALQHLLKTFLTYWRNRDANKPVATSGDIDDGTAVGDGLR